MSPSGQTTVCVSASAIGPCRYSSAGYDSAGTKCRLAQLQRRLVRESDRPAAAEEDERARRLAARGQVVARVRARPARRPPRCRSRCRRAEGRGPPLRSGSGRPTPHRRSRARRCARRMSRRAYPRSRRRRTRGGSAEASRGRARPPSSCRFERSQAARRSRGRKGTPTRGRRRSRLLRPPPAPPRMPAPCRARFHSRSRQAVRPRAGAARQRAGQGPRPAARRPAEWRSHARSRSLDERIRHFRSSNYRESITRG